MPPPSQALEKFRRKDGEEGKKCTGDFAKILYVPNGDLRNVQ